MFLRVSPTWNKYISMLAPTRTANSYNVMKKWNYSLSDQLKIPCIDVRYNNANCLWWVHPDKQIDAKEISRDVQVV